MTASQQQADANNRFIATTPEVSRERWIEMSLQRLVLTIEAWPAEQRLAAWRTIALAAEDELRRLTKGRPTDDGPPDLTHDPYYEPDDSPAQTAFPDDF